ncbi:MAG: VRR-NUC domain-containing protein [Puniceicoccales bacterium]|jgi:hypothetical protein|nr:VRR-NUC domain-containing protein [Puniceicoccales bacterium]
MIFQKRENFAGFMNNHEGNSAHWSEDQHQRELFRWINGEIEKGRESFRLIGYISNGIRMLRWTAVNNAGELGLRIGMPDLYYMRPNSEFHGLFIELKSEKPTAKISGTQREMLGLLEKQRYRTAVCRGHQEAIEIIQDYDGKRS